MLCIGQSLISVVNLGHAGLSSMSFSVDYRRQQQRQAVLPPLCSRPAQLQMAQTLGQSARSRAQCCLRPVTMHSATGMYTSLQQCQPVTPCRLLIQTCLIWCKHTVSEVKLDPCNVDAFHIHSNDRPLLKPRSNDTLPVSSTLTDIHCTYRVTRNQKRKGQHRAASGITASQPFQFSTETRG